MLDLGISKGNGNYEDESNYNKKYLNELEIGEEITGIIHIGELKKRQIKNKDVEEFYVILKNKNEKTKWICGLITSAYHDDGVDKIYGEHGGRVYELIDSLSHALNITELNELESYSVVFDTFRETINNKLESVTVKAVQASNPNAKTPNLQIVKATAKDNTEKEPETAPMPTKKESIKEPVPMGDDPQARQYIKEIREELKLRNNIPDATPEEVVKWAVKMADEWDLSSNDITRIKAQAAREIQGK